MTVYRFLALPYRRTAYCALLVVILALNTSSTNSNFAAIIRSHVRSSDQLHSHNQAPYFTQLMLFFVQSLRGSSSLVFCQRSYPGEWICHRADARQMTPTPSNLLYHSLRQRRDADQIRDMRKRQIHRATPIKDVRRKQNEPRRRLSDEELKRLAVFLDTKDKPFSVDIRPALPQNTKSKRSEVIEGDLHDPALAVRYVVRPFQRWKSLRRYKKFTSMWLFHHKHRGLSNAM